MTPAPLYLLWRSRMIRIRQDDPRLRPYTPNADRLTSAMQLASDVQACGSCWERQPLAAMRSISRMTGRGPTMRITARPSREARG